jgi:hypothetical protein
MIKANSLLYAVYVCLIIGLLCGAILLQSNLYNQLNVYYNIHEELYLNNASTINYALGIGINYEDESLINPVNQIESRIQKKKHGLLSVLLVESIIKNDTIASAHFVGQYSNSKTALYVSNFTQPISASGKVTLKGDVFLPSDRISEIYINNKPNQIRFQNSIKSSTINLPEISSICKTVFNNFTSQKVSINSLEKRNDSLYVNSFFNETKEIQITNNQLENIIIKGNFVIRSNDSLVISKSAQLEDVIIIAPKVTVLEGFEGTIQVFADEKIYINKKVKLNYPSSICVQNNGEKGGMIFIDEETKIDGVVMLFGNDLLHIENNLIEIKDKTQIRGTVYSSGVLSINGKVFGAVYAAKLLYKTSSSSYSNCIADVEIDINKKPKYYIYIPIFETNKNRYGVVKKIF